MKNNRMKNALENIARRGVPENTNLWLRIESRLNKRNSFMQTLRARPVMAIVILMLALSLLTGVVYAIGRSLGYIPGIGVVEQSMPLRVLAEPVTMERQGITVTVSKVVADATRTFVAYRVDGIPFVENGNPTCFILPEIHLPDGSNLEMIGGSGGTALVRNGDFMFYEDGFAYSPIPNGGNTAIFVLPCVSPEGIVLENWNLTLDLVPAPAGYATPAVEIAVTADGDENKTGLHLEKVIELADSYILIGKFTDAGDLPGPLSMSTSSDSEYLPHIEDANGNPVSFMVREDARPDPNWDVAYYWAYEIQKPVVAPLKITVDSVNIRKDDLTARLQFDTGPNPKPMQEWKLDLPIHLGEYQYVIDSVTMTEDGYLFKYHSGLDVPAGISLYPNIVDSPEPDGTFSEQSNLSDKVVFTDRITYPLPLPTGLLTVEFSLSDQTAPLQGPWTLFWTPPNANP